MAVKSNGGLRIVRLQLLAGLETLKAGAGSAMSSCIWSGARRILSRARARGNSGVFLQGRYEIQVLDSYENPTYSNGQAASVYKQHIPLVNASLPAGEWQSYDVVFRAPRFSASGELQTPAFVTLLHNGILVLDQVEIQGTTTYIGQPSYTPHGSREPLMLQDHGNPVSFRNIWVRELRPQQISQ